MRDGHFSEGNTHTRCCSWLPPLDDEVCQNLLAKLGTEEGRAVYLDDNPDCTSMHCGACNLGLLKYKHYIMLPIIKWAIFPSRLLDLSHLYDLGDHDLDGHLLLLLCPGPWDFDCFSKVVKTSKFSSWLTEISISGYGEIEIWTLIPSSWDCGRETCFVRQG